jgi:hypothetical protein
MARGTTLIPARRQALSGVRTVSLYSCPSNGGQLRLSYFEPNFLTHANWTDFRSRLREDFRPFPLPRLTLIPGSLSAVQGLLVPIIAF